jgi:TetR/AcrR family transcriptional regulator, transcriptional repressor for nem operon
MTKAEKTRQFIIERSAPIFNTRGVAGTSMSDIMEATGLAKGSLYVHFENKDELSYCAVDHTLNSFVKRIMAVVGEQKTARNKLYAILDFLSDPANPPVTGGCPMLNFGMEADDTSPVILRKVDCVVEAMIQQLADIVEQGISAGEFKRSFNADEFATRTFALIEGGILITRVSRKRDKMDLIIRMIKQEIENQLR